MVAVFEDYFPNIELFNLENGTELDILKKEFFESCYNKIPASRILDILEIGQTISNPYCKGALIECEYVDRDYTDGYTYYYSKAFMDYQKRSKRVHFFKDNLNSFKEDILGAFSSKKKVQIMNKWLEENYLGYSIICPNYPTTIGRTVIDPPRKPEWVPHSKSSFTVNLLGFNIKVKGVPFIEQDYRVSACATSAIWMASTSVLRNFNGGRGFSPIEITVEGGSRFIPLGRVIPNQGLTIEQINWAFKGMELDPLLYEGPFEVASAKNIIYKYVESNIPVLLVVKRIERNEREEIIETGGLHAIVVTGHLYDWRANPESNNLKVKAGGIEHEIPYNYSSDWVDGFIAHDDQRGPYRELRLNEESGLNEELGLAEDDPGVCVISEDYSTYEGGEMKYEGILQTIITPLPKKIFISAEKVERKGIRLFLKFYELFYQSLPTNFVLRTYLVPSNNFKKTLIGDSGMPEDLIRWYRGELLSRYVWVIEVGEKTFRAGKKPDEIKIFGEVLIDSTSSVLNNDFLAIHFPHHIVMMNPKLELTHYDITGDGRYSSNYGFL